MRDVPEIVEMLAEFPSGMTMVIASSTVSEYGMQEVIRGHHARLEMGGGGKIAKGTQYMSWVARTDVLRAFEFLIATPQLSGPVNVTSPSPVPNAQFSETLAHVLHRPSVATVPEFAIKLMFGEMGEETLLSGQRATPKRLLGAGFTFEYPELSQALRHELGK